MAEQVFNVAQLGRQAGTFAAPGAAVAGAFLLPVTEPINVDLDRASGYPVTDFGRNVRNLASMGYHGVRGASLPLNADATFNQIMHFLEMHYAGTITPTGAGPYTWVYPLEGGAPTLKPYTVKSGSETSQDQWNAVGVLIDELTMGFDDLDAPGSHPWTIQGSALALDRTVTALTGALTPPAILEAMLGHFTIIKEGSTATAFGSLVELAAHLVSFSITTRRSLVRRAYGGTTDIAVGYGFSEKTSGEVTAKIKISATAQSDIHDAWNSSGAALGEKRWRITVDGSGNNQAHLDFRFGMVAVPIGERQGERVYEVSGEIVDDTTLTAPAAWTVINDNPVLV